MSTEKSEKYLLVAITGLVSLAVGVGSGRLLDFLRAQSPKLVYSVASAETFPGQNQRTGILLVRAGNAGGKEAEDVLVRVSVPGASVREQMVTGVPNVDQLVKVASDSIEFRLPFLNPGEQVSVHLLLDITAAQTETPVVEVRGKGVSGTQEDVTEGRRNERSELLSLSGGVLSALGTSFAFMMLLRRRLGVTLGSTHADDQRDVFAYVLDVYELHSEADDLRRTTRERTYWSIADQLVGKWLAGRQEHHIVQGARALEHLINYADMAGSSRDLIRVSLARLRAAAGDNAGARRELDAITVRSQKSRVIRTRIADDPRLSALMPSEDVSKTTSA